MDCSTLKTLETFWKKIQKGNFPENFLLVIANVVRLYPNIPYEGGIEALKTINLCRLNMLCKCLISL